MERNIITIGLYLDESVRELMWWLIEIERSSTEYVDTIPLGHDSSQILFEWRNSDMSSAPTQNDRNIEQLLQYLTEKKRWIRLSSVDSKMSFFTGRHIMSTSSVEERARQEDEIRTDPAPQERFFWTSELQNIRQSGRRVSDKEDRPPYFHDNKESYTHDSECSLWDLTCCRHLKSMQIRMCITCATSARQRRFISPETIVSVQDSRVVILDADTYSLTWQFFQKDPAKKYA